MSDQQQTGSDLTRLYRDAIRQHSSNPVGYRQPIDATHRHESYNPQCGDRVEVLLRVRGETVEAAAFDGEACAICMASASLLCSLAPGLSLTHLQELGCGLQATLSEAPNAAIEAASAAAAADSDADRTNAMKSQTEPALHPDLRPLLGVRPYPSRVQCALLPWAAAERALSG